LLKSIFRKKIDDINAYEEFTFTPKALETGKESFEENSLINGFYFDYIVTKTGYLVAILEATGINLDLMNTEEQEEVFNDYNSLLMATLTGESNDIQQNIDTTFPVDFDLYVKSWKKQYLNNLADNDCNEILENLTASYVQEYAEYQRNSIMSTKRHLVVIKNKIKKNNEDSLLFSKQELDDHVKDYTKAIESALSQYDMQIRLLNNIEVKKILKHMI